VLDEDRRRRHSEIGAAMVGTIVKAREQRRYYAGPFATRQRSLSRKSIRVLVRAHRLQFWLAYSYLRQNGLC